MNLIIVIPCFNEANRFEKQKFIDFINNTNDVGLVFVDDGSTDKTFQLLSKLSGEFSNRMSVVRCETNKGKASAVKAGFQFVFDNFSCKKIAYLDADLSASLEECQAISILVDGEIKFVFGSRILKIDNVIKRKWYRYFFGRIVATFISRSLGLPVYDTQCGCKIFEISLAKKIFTDPFISRWLFDVELFHRMIRLFGRENMPAQTKEVPLNAWIDAKKSKVKFTYFFKLWLDLFAINSFYNK